MQGCGSEIRHRDFRVQSCLHRHQRLICTLVCSLSRLVPQATSRCFILKLSTATRCGFPAGLNIAGRALPAASLLCNVPVELRSFN
jgi:hypothetical protein